MMIHCLPLWVLVMGVQGICASPEVLSTPLLCSSFGLSLPNPLALPCASFLVVSIILWAPVIFQWFPFLLLLARIFCCCCCSLQVKVLFYFHTSNSESIFSFFPCLPPEITFKTFLYEAVFYTVIKRILPLCPVFS